MFDEVDGLVVDLVEEDVVARLNVRALVGLAGCVGDHAMQASGSGIRLGGERGRRDDDRGDGSQGKNRCEHQRCDAERSVLHIVLVAPRGAARMPADLYWGGTLHSL